MITDDLANYTLILLDYDADLIIIGRENMRKEDNDINYIVIDELVSVPDGILNGFDGDTEQQQFDVSLKGSFTINFFGTDARANAVKWLGLHKTQLSRETQRDLSISVYHATNFRNLKALEGSKFNNRYEIEIQVRYNETETINTLRIDTAETTLIVNN